MQYPRRPPASSTYESQAARWKQGFKPVGAQSARQTDLEGALVSELCSSIGSSSFPPRDVLQKLLRYLHTLDHEYVCELLNEKFQNPLWQVQAKALSVLDAILKSSENEFYKRYYYERRDILEGLCRARKDMLRTRAEKVYNVVKDYAPPPVKTPVDHGLMHTSPVITSAKPPAPDLMSGFDSPRSNSEPLPGPAPVPVSAFSFIGSSAPQDEEYDSEPEAAKMASPSPPTANSAFSFLNAAGTSSTPDGAHQPPAAAGAAVPAQPKSAPSAFNFITSTASPTASPVGPHAAPAPSAPSMSAVGISGFSFMNQQVEPTTPPVSPTSASTAAPSTAGNASAFAFMASTPSQNIQPVHPAQPRHDVFDSLPAPTLSVPGVVQPTQVEEEKEEEEEESDPIHDAFEGLSTDTDSNQASAFALQQAAAEYARRDEEQTPISMGELREVILEVEVPPGPMGIMLDRSIVDMVVIERFIPLPSGQKGYLEMHPAICPGCALVSINSIHVEDQGLDEVGPILGSLSAQPKVLRFKKLMNGGRTANPSTLMIPYVPPPLETDDTADADEQDDDGVSQHDSVIAESGDSFMDQLNGYNDGLVQIERKLAALLSRERNGISVGDRRNELAQMHGTVEKIQTQGIDSVIFGPNPPPNYEEVKQYRSSLVRKAEALAKRLDFTVHSAPGTVMSESNSEMSSPESSMVAGFGQGTITLTDASSVDPPLGLSQLQGDSGFHFMNNGAADDAETERHSGSSYGFSFLRNAPTAVQSSASQAPTSPSSSFGFLQNSAASAGAPMAGSSGEAAASVFAGLNLRDESPGSGSDLLSVSSHGRPMGIQDLSVSASSMARIGASGSLAPSSTMATAGTSVPAGEDSYSAFGFMSTNDPSDTLTSSSSDTELPASPTAFGFLRGNASSMTATASSTSSQLLPAHSNSGVPASESGSMFSFISS